jgi:hypothetical protein
MMSALYFFHSFFLAVINIWISQKTKEPSSIIGMAPQPSVSTWSDGKFLQRASTILLST